MNIKDGKVFLTEPAELSMVEKVFQQYATVEEFFHKIGFAEENNRVSCDHYHLVRRLHNQYVAIMNGKGVLGCAHMDKIKKLYAKIKL